MLIRLNQRGIILNNHSPGFTMVEVIVVTGIISLLAAIGIPANLKSRMTANEVSARATLRSISNAFGMYLAANSNYPSQEADLLFPDADPPYLNRPYDGQTVRGYTYNYQFIGGYTVVATPIACGNSGSKIFTLNENNVISEADC